MEPLESLGRMLEGMQAEIATLRGRCDQLERQLAEAQPQLLTTREFCRRYGWTEGKLKAALFQRATNGLAAAIVQRVKGGPILIDPRLFFETLKGRKQRRPRRPR